MLTSQRGAAAVARWRQRCGCLPWRLRTVPVCATTEEELSALLELMLGQERSQVTNSLTLRHSVEIIKHLSLVPGESAKDEASVDASKL